VCNLQSASDAAAAGRPWAGDAIAALVRGGLGVLRLAHAEFAAQAANPFGDGLNECEEQMIMDPIVPLDLRCTALGIVDYAAQGIQQPALRALARQGLVAPLLQVGKRCSVALSAAEC
jgi:hypothetical protein